MDFLPVLPEVELGTRETAEHGDSLALLETMLAEVDIALAAGRTGRVVRLG
jgi:hypothetical protein